VRRGRWICVCIVLTSVVVCGSAGAAVPGRCEPGAPPPSAAPAPATALAELEGLIDNIPCASSGSVSFGTTDNLGEQLGVLDPIPDPAGGYLGVYQSPFRLDGHEMFRVSLGYSTDLTHWKRIRVLIGRDASMPTVRQIAGASGYLLAYEQALTHGRGDVAVLRYYPTASALESGRYTAQTQLPRRFSPYNDGTPTIAAVSWRGSPSRSQILLGFHYESDPDGRRGPDREAFGWVFDFRRWGAWRDSGIDSELDQLGLVGNHGDWREFTFAGIQWRIYEAQQRFDSFATWHLLLWNAGTGVMSPLTLATGTTSRITSVGNPVVNIEPAPAGGGQVLVITAFVFDASQPADDGELVYYVRS
jgi:hypothetical protein